MQRNHIQREVSRVEHNTTPNEEYAASSYTNCIIDKTNCQVYKGEETKKDIEELKERETLSKFEKKFQQRAEYENLVKSRLTPLQKYAWTDCCSQIWIRKDGTISSLQRCKNRLCSLCSWRAAQGHFAEVMQMVSEIERLNETEPPIYLFATFTIKNCAADELTKTIDKMMQGINRMQSNRAWKSRVKAFIRHMEVTIGQDKKSFHPHIHYILQMPNTYFSDEKIFLSWKQWRAMWCKAAQIDYEEENQCKIEYIRRNEIEKAVAEVSKYAVKLTKDISDQSEVMIAKLIAGLKRRRLHAYGGEFKKLHQTIEKTKDYYSPYDAIPEGKPYIRASDGTYMYAKKLEILKKQQLTIDKRTGEIVSPERAYRETERKAFKAAFERKIKRNGNNSSQNERGK